MEPITLRVSRIILLIFLLVGLLRTEVKAAQHFAVEERVGQGDYVVLVHGVEWFRNSLEPTATYLNQAGYYTLNLRWPTRLAASTEDVGKWVGAMIHEHCRDKRANSETPLRVEKRG